MSPWSGFRARWRRRTRPWRRVLEQRLALLAMALTGERVDVEMLTRVLEVHGAEPEAKP